MDIPGEDNRRSPVESEKHQVAKYPSQKKPEMNTSLLFNWKLTVFELVRAAVTQYHSLMA